MAITCLVTAMTAESKPLIEAFGLTPVPQRGLSAWTGDHLCLLQTGMGAQRAAARLETLMSIQTGIDAFINVGIAGGDRPIGRVVLASSVHDYTTGRRWYPHLPPQMGATSAHPSTEQSLTEDYCEVVTVAEPSTQYQKNCVFDMEAAAVVKAATQYTDLSRIQCVKVVSDNPENPIDDFSVKNVGPWIRSAMPTVQLLIDWLASAEHKSTTDNFKTQVHRLVTHITELCHHSTTETHQLRRLLERYLALYGELPSIDTLGKLDNSKRLLKHLDEQLLSYPVNY